jgi:CRISPR-associated protein (TIGR03986 family)
VSQQPDGQDKERTGYDSPLNPKVLRGRKVYPHHAGLPDGYWDPENARKRALVGERYLEYPRPLQNDQELRDRQNRSITEWVRPGARFCFTIYVSNLSDVELGALLWLLSLPADHFHRLGSGKPLGFGSVRLAIRRAHLRRGSLWESHYASLGQPTDPDALSIIRGPDDDQLRLVIERFKEAVDAAYGSPPARREEDLNSRFERVAFIEAFLRALRGHDDRLPIHYPRVDPRPDPAGENYRWFAQNERGGRLSLPDLASDRGLPYRP